MEKISNTLLENRDKVYPLMLDWYWSMPEKDEILMKIRPVYSNYIKRSDIVIKDLREYVEKKIKDDLDKGFVKIKDISPSRVVVAFDSAHWLRENFLKNPKMEFHLPRTIEFKYKKRLPDTLMGHTSWKVVREFIEKKFKDFIKTHNKTLFKRKMKIMKKVNYNWFDYEANINDDRIFVRMKPKVMFALAAAGYLAKKVITG